MKKIVFPLVVLVGCFLFPSIAHTQSKSEKAIRAAMAAQEVAWNTGDLPGFMEGYWKSDRLCFIGSRGLTYGWEETLSNYQKGYPTKEAMGTLSFTILSVQLLSKKSAYVVGKWKLDRQKDTPSGHFSLLWRKINGKWYIVSDHSS